VGVDEGVAKTKKVDVKLKRVFDKYQLKKVSTRSIRIGSTNDMVENLQIREFDAIVVGGWADQLGNRMWCYVVTTIRCVLPGARALAGWTDVRMVTICSWIACMTETVTEGPVATAIQLMRMTESERRDYVRNSDSGNDSTLVCKTASIQAIFSHTIEPLILADRLKMCKLSTYISGEENWKKGADPNHLLLSKIKRYTR